MSMNESIGMPRRKRPMNNYDWCFGQGANWYDLNTGKTYMLQEYKEAIARGEHPEGIRVAGNPLTVTLGYVSPEKLKQIMEDPPPDPRY